MARTFAGNAALPTSPASYRIDLPSYDPAGAGGWFYGTSPTRAAAQQPSAAPVDRSYWSNILSQPAQPPAPPQNPPPAQPPTRTFPGQSPNTPVPPGSSFDWPGGGYGGGGTAVPNPWTDFTNQNPLEQSEQNRLLAKGWWDALEQDTRDAQNRYQNIEAGFTDRLFSGPGGYGQILAGQGGFTPEEQQRLLQWELLQSGLVTEEELSALNLQPYEIQSILGDPYAAREIVGGKLQALELARGESATRQREAYQQLINRLDDYAGRESLGLSQDFDPRQMAAIGELGNAYRDTLDPAKLGLSEEFLNLYRWSPQDTEALASQAGRTVGMRGQSERDALERSAFAAGNVNPLALEAAASRNKVYSDIAAADAIHNARLSGKQMELDTARNREQMRLDSAFGLSDRQMAAAENIAGKKLTQGEAYEVLRLQAERDRADRMTDAAKTGESTRLATERDIGEKETALGQYGTNLVYDATRYGEAEGSRRSSDLAQNRQQLGQYGVDTRFGQASSASGDMSNRWGGILSQRKAEEAEGRDYLSEQQRRAQEGAATTRQQRIGAGGTAMGGIGQATGTAAEINIPWHQVLQGFLPK